MMTTIPTNCPDRFSNLGRALCLTSQRPIWQGWRCLCFLCSHLLCRSCRLWLLLSGALARLSPCLCPCLCPFHFDSAGCPCCLRQTPIVSLRLQIRFCFLLHSHLLLSSHGRRHHPDLSSRLMRHRRQLLPLAQPQPQHRPHRWCRHPRRSSSNSTQLGLHRSDPENAPLPFAGLGQSWVAARPAARRGRRSHRRSHRRCRRRCGRRYCRHHPRWLQLFCWSSDWQCCLWWWWE
mmetsp:Transcript_40639/g.87268  ORF Transcript_40639/g.87268 Transcript_40639/m.87268 type:complete len:234 (+) Transcript_40639:920-1621(+)